MPPRRRARSNVIQPKRRRRSGRARFVVATLAMMGAIFATVLLLPTSDPIHSVEDMTKDQLETRQKHGDRFSCKVAYVNDGDTLRCADSTRVRLHAVAARESDETCSPGHPCPSSSAASATATLRSLVSGRTLSCAKVGTSYNRITAICWTPDDQEVNCAMIRSGTTLVWDRFNRQTPICQS